MIEVLNDKELIPLSLGEDDIEDLDSAGLLGMNDINEYIGDLELEYENLKKQRYTQSLSAIKGYK